MTRELWFGLFFLASSAAGAIAAARHFALRRRTLERLDEGLHTAETETAAEEEHEPPRLFARRHYVIPWGVALAVLVVLHWVVGLPWAFAGAFAAIVGLLGTQLDAALLTWTSDRIEAQLADAIDLMISALRVGAALPVALEQALQEARVPLKPQLEELLGRIRLGDDPIAAFNALSERVPLETFRLFSMALSVHWGVGGSLTGTLANVGRTIRQRIEVSRRLRALTTQARTSIVAIMGSTYFIAVLMWRNDPERMANFLDTSVGASLAAVAIVLQAVGMVWISYLSKPRF
ncbi:MAG: type II secretion system F family protein [Planctomycetes bacterium]|nr:type II secretion system F family protein [Planctomycetota bacterium]